jgi:hypothetical protein
VLLLVNRFGATALIELYLMANSTGRIGRCRAQSDAFPDRVLRYITGHGRRIDDGIRARRPGERVGGCAGAHRSDTLGRLMRHFSGLPNVGSIALRIDLDFAILLTLLAVAAAQSPLSLLAGDDASGGRGWPEPQ